MSQQNEIRKKSRFKIKYGKKKSLPQVPLVIVEQCDRDLNNNNNNSKFLSTKATTDLHFTCLNESLKPFELCRFQKHSLSCLHHGTSKTFPSTLYKWKSCIQIKAEISSDKLTTNLQDTSDEICNCHNIIPECNPIQEHLIISKIPSTDIGLCTLSSPNDPSVNFCFNKTIFQNICDVSPASIQRAKRMELVKLTNSQANRSNNSLLNSDRQTTSSFEDNVDKLKSTCSLPEENITHCEQMLYTKPILSPYSPFTDTELNKIPSACHFFPDSKGNPYILFPTQMNNVLPNSSSCSSFNSLGTISSPPSTNASDSNLHYTNNKIYQTSETELCNRDLNGIEHQVTTSSQSLNLLSPITTYASNNNNTSNNNIRKPNSLLTNNYDVLLRCSMNLKKSTTNKSRIKSLGDIFKIPRLSFSSESYPKKSCTYQNINKIDTDIVKSDISNNSPQSSIELCSLTDNAINSKADANFLTVPCETTLLRKKLQIRNKYVRYSTEYVNTTEVVEQEEEHHRTQRAVSVDMSQTFQHRKKMLLQSNDNKATSNMKLWNCMQSSCYYVQPNKSSQQQQQQPQQQQVNNERLRTSLGTLNSLISATPNWTNDAVIGEHLWNETTSTETCYVDESECTKSGVKRKCSVCHIICHVNCLPLVQVSCRPTFREAYIHDYRNERTYTTHHWVRRRKQNKKCKHCGKSLQSILGFSSKEYITIQCTWCKIGYHNKSACFRESFLTQPCSLGPYSDLVVPPDWIIKLTDGNNCKSTSICRSNSFIASSHLSDHEVNISSIRSSISRPESLNHSNQILNNLSQQESSIITETSITTVHENSQSTSISQANLFVPPNVSFVIKTNPTNAACLKPLLVFLNPKSGGNQAYSLMKKFQWLLNPRQVFDLSQGGPKMGLELFSRVPNLRILVCGGDGTVGWIFSTIDSMNFNSIPPVAVLPLGTGNDLARALNWGSGYIDESISKILASVYDGRVIALDRWQVNSEVRTDFQPSQQLTDYEDDESTRNRPISDGLPLKVFNNYFSLGADAATALEFHESREANPERFNSRLKNKLFYAGLGGKDLLRRSWRDLSEHITLVCDDEDLTPLIRSLKPHCILFLNIPRYGSGTLPWGHPESEFQPQRIDDGYIEVIGLTSTTLATLQIGGHGDRICQCRRVRLTTDIVIPMQMDGEPCRLVPSVIDVFCSHQALVIQKITRPPGSAALLNEFCNGCNCLGSK